FVFDGMPEEKLAPILERHDISRDEISQPCNVTLLRDGDRLILFDAGAGPLFMPTAGDLAMTLDGLGLAPEDITDIVFTHGHPDHLWGVLDDFDELLFPEAAYHFGQAEWDYWSDPDTVNTIGEARAAFAVGAQRRLDAIAEKTAFFTDGDEVLPGIMAHATPGHTPGHMSFEIATGGDPVLVAGDAVTNAHVNFEQPGWPSGSDQNPELGAETRARLLDMAAADGMRLIGFHLPGGGIGRVERTGGAYRFVGEDA
ncbi:MBL fold metallo-hydrolase, partial [Roseovarius sp. HI0049]